MTTTRSDSGRTTTGSRFKMNTRRMRQSVPALAVVAMLAGFSGVSAPSVAGAATVPGPTGQKPAPANPGTKSPASTSGPSPRASATPNRASVRAAAAVAATASLKATPASGNAPLAVTFDGSGSTSVATWSLNFGDGSPVATGTGPITATTLPGHTYTALGVFAPALTVSDGTNPASTTTATVTSNGPAPDGSCTLSGTTRACNLWARADGTVKVGTKTIPVWGFTQDSGAQSALPGPKLVATVGETLNLNLVNELDSNAGPVVIEIPGVVGAPDPTPGAVHDAGAHLSSFKLTTPGTYVFEAAGTTPGGARQVAMGLSGILIVRPTTGANYAYGSSATMDFFNTEKVVAVTEIDSEYNADPFVKDLVEYKPNYFFLNGVAYDPAKTVTMDPSTAGFNPALDNIRFDVATGDKVLVRYVNLGLRDHSLGLINLRQTETARDSNRLNNPVDERAEWLTSGQAADTFIQIPPDATLNTQYPLYDAGFHMNNAGETGLGGIFTYFNVAKGVAGSPVGPIVACPTVTATCPPAISVTSTDGNFPATNQGVDLTVTVNLVAQGAGVSVKGAQWFLDTAGAPATANPITPTSGAFGGPTATVVFTIPWATLQPLLAAGPQGAFGDHIIWVQGIDSNNVVGQAAGDVVSLPVRDALVSGLEISPAVTNGTSTPSAVADIVPPGVAVIGTATASLASYGIQAVEACIVPATGAAPTDADVAKCGANGANLALAIPPPPPPPPPPTPPPPVSYAHLVPISGSITPPTADGNYWVLVHAQETFNTDTTQTRWGPWLSKDPATNAVVPGTYKPLTVVTAARAPIMSAMALNPNPNNGFQDGPGNLGLFAAEQVTATATSPAGATIALAEAFLGTSYPKGSPTPALPILCTAPNTPAGCLDSGSGSEMIPNSGKWNDTSTKAVSGYLPLADFLAQADGLVPVYVHAKDAAGNWGPLLEIDLTLDKTAPIVNSATKTTAGNAAVTATDPVKNGVSTGIVAAEWYTGADPGFGNGKAIPGIPAAASPGASVNFPVATGRPAGTVVNIRVRDAAGTWSATVPVTV